MNSSAVTDYGPLKDFCEDIVTLVRKPSTGRDLVSFLLGSAPFNHVAYSSDAFRDALGRVLAAKRFDVVQIEFSTMWQYADIFNGLPVVLDAHNVEYEIIRQVRQFYKNPLRKLLYSLEEAKLKTKEEQAWKECSLCFTVSEKERAVIAQTRGHSDTVIAVSNGVDPERFFFSPKTAADRRLLLLGGMRFQPNLDSALYFLKEILPEIQLQIPDVRIEIVGSELWRIKNYQSYTGVQFQESIPDVLPYFRQADVLLVPLRYGAGTRVKILEAMAAGLPVVTTSKGCEGIDVRNGEHLMIADSLLSSLLL